MRRLQGFLWRTLQGFITTEASIVPRFTALALPTPQPATPPHIPILQPSFLRLCVRCKQPFAVPKPKSPHLLCMNCAPLERSRTDCPECHCPRKAARKGGAQGPPTILCADCHHEHVNASSREKHRLERLRMRGEGWQRDTATLPVEVGPRDTLAFGQAILNPRRRKPHLKAVLSQASRLGASGRRREHLEQAERDQERIREQVREAKREARA